MVNAAAAKGRTLLPRRGGALGTCDVPVEQVDCAIETNRAGRLRNRQVGRAGGRAPGVPHASAVHCIRHMEPGNGLFCVSAGDPTPHRGRIPSTNGTW